LFGIIIDFIALLTVHVHVEIIGETRYKRLNLFVFPQRYKFVTFTNEEKTAYCILLSKESHIDCTIFWMINNVTLILA
jgi:hypothetical protein